MDTPRAVIIGGGVGGLTAAVALHRSGWQVTVLERADSMEPVGAGISLAPNAQRALDVIGLGDEIRSLAAWQGEGGMRSPDGRWLSRTDSAAAAERFGGPLVLLHRATLIDRVAAGLPASAVRTGCPAHLVDPGTAGGRPAVIGTPDGPVEADLVIGADGIHSAVRGVLFPDHPGPSYAGFTARRVWSPRPPSPSPRTRPGAVARSGAASRSRTAGSTPTRRPSPRRVRGPTTTSGRNCCAGSVTGTSRFPGSSPPPNPEASSVTTSTR